MSYYYALYDNQCGDYMHTGFNGRSREEVREGLVSYLLTDADEEDIPLVENSSLDELCAVADMTLEKRTRSFNKV